LAHPVDTVCQVGFASYAEQPEPAPLHALSVQPLGLSYHRPTVLRAAQAMMLRITA
jgi:hypothetical protein